MSFLGCIGHVLKCSGLKEALELVYAENAVNHMLSGKAYARAIRGHFLVDSSLNALILQRVYGVSFPTDEADINKQPDLKLALEKFDSLLDCLDEATTDPADETLKRIAEQIDSEKSKIKQTPTGKLWIQYMEMVDLMKLLLKAQRTGQFVLYLHTLQECFYSMQQLDIITMQSL